MLSRIVAINCCLSLRVIGPVVSIMSLTSHPVLLLYN